MSGNESGALVSKSGAWRAAAVAGVSLGQLLPGFFIAAALPVLYREQGFELKDIWVFFLPQIPGWLKFLWGPLIDRFTNGALGPRRTWIVFVTLAAAVIYGVIGAIQPSPQALMLLLWLLVFRSVVTSLMDVAIDAYTVEQYRAAPRTGASVVALAEMLGPVLASAVFMVLLDRFGWTPAVWAASAALLVFTAPAALRREAPFPRAAEARASFMAFFQRRDAWWIVAAVPLATAAAYFPTMGDSLALTDRNLTLSQIGIIIGLGQALGLAAGAIVAPVLLKALTGRAMSVIPVLSALAPLVTGLALHAEGLSVPALSVLFAVGGFLLSPFLVMISAKRMQWAMGPQVATDFAIQSSLARVGYSGAGFALSASAGYFGWQQHYIIAAAAVLAFGAVFLVLAHRIEKLRPPSSG
jgi:Major Facilitator Superfamily